MGLTGSNIAHEAWVPSPSSTYTSAIWTSRTLICRQYGDHFEGLTAAHLTGYSSFILIDKSQDIIQCVHWPIKVQSNCPQQRRVRSRRPLQGRSTRFNLSPINLHFSTNLQAGRMYHNCWTMFQWNFHGRPRARGLWAYPERDTLKVLKGIRSMNQKQQFPN